MNKAFPVEVKNPVYRISLTYFNVPLLAKCKILRDREYTNVFSVDHLKKKKKKRVHLLLIKDPVLGYFRKM
jgi:hypothetical protein